MPLNINGNIISSNDITSLGVFDTKVNRDGLVLYYDAQNLNSYTSGSVWNDLSGNGFNGNLSGNTQLSSGHMYFDGTTDYVNIGSNAAYNSLTNITLDVWCYPTRSSSYEYLFSNARDCCGTYYGYEMWFNLGTPSFQIWNGTSVGVNSGSAITLNQYYNIVSTYDGNALKIYVNGVLLGTTGSVAGIGTPASFNLYVGRMGMSDLYSYQGYIDIARVYNRALNPYEVAENFQAQRGRFGL